MCNLYSQTKAPEAIRQLFMERGMALLFPDGIPNLQPRDVAITDPAPIVRGGLKGTTWSYAAGAGQGRTASQSTTSAPMGGNFPPAAA